MQDLEKTVRMRPTANPKHIVHMFDGENPPQIIDLDSYGKKEIAFGRNEENDIVLSSKLVSRKHGKFVSEDGEWKIIDLGSTNGIVHNGLEVQVACLQNNDIVRIDDQTESKKDGVLMLFCEDNLSNSWRIVPSEKYTVNYNLRELHPSLNAIMECINGTYCIFFEGAGIFFNGEEKEKRVKLHEKDIISNAFAKIVFTSNAIYANCLFEEEQIPNNENDDLEKTMSQKTMRMRRVPAFSEGSNSSENMSSGTQMPQQESTPPKSFTAEEKGESGVRKFFASTAGYYVLCLLMILIVWGITLALWLSQGEIAMVVILICTIFGWQALNKIQPVMFLWMSWVGWLIYFFIKFILSALIGLFVAPFKLGKLIAGAISDSLQ